MKKIWLITLVILIIGIGLGAFYVFCMPKVAYVEIPKIFNGFEMKKELQGKFEKTQAARKSSLDSLSAHLQLLSQRLQAEKENEQLLREFDAGKSDFFNRKKLFESDNANLSSQY